MKIRVTVPLLAVLVVASLPPSADATFPGRNGRILFSGSNDTACGSPPRSVARSADSEPCDYVTLPTSLFAVDLSGARLTEMESLAFDCCPGGAVSSNGRRIAYGDGELGIANADGSGRRLVGVRGRSPAWSPDEQKLIYARDPTSWARPMQLYTFDLATRRRHWIANGVEPDWSRRGIVFARDQSRDPHRSHLYAISANGGPARQLTRGPRVDRSPSWSPDARRIVFERDGHIAVVGARGGKARQLTRGRASNSDPVWSPDGRLIAFSRGTDLYVMTSSGHRPRRIVRDGAEPAWQALP
jgi:WD40-like Beta Propeller Repeat